MLAGAWQAVLPELLRLMPRTGQLKAFKDGRGWVLTSPHNKQLLLAPSMGLVCGQACTGGNSMWEFMCQ